MGRPARTLFGRLFFTVTCVVVTAAGLSPSGTIEGAVPEGQSYIGVKKCASCHFQQYMTWAKTKHAKTFDLLPANYQTDATCIKCHTTGHGEPTGFKDKATTPNLVGTSCEKCHGPGSKHEEICKAFGKEKLAPAQEEQARGSIYLMLPKNICVECHKAEGHGETGTPKELRTK